MYDTEQFVQSVHMITQDRRITKTRKAIYAAFLQLLNQKNFETITVQEIIDIADVGRSTFYSHYESKEFCILRKIKTISPASFSQKMTTSSVNYRKS